MKIGLLKGNFVVFELKTLKYALSIIKTYYLDVLYIRSAQINESNQLIKASIKPYRKLKLEDDQYHYDYEFEYHEIIDIDDTIFKKISKRTQKALIKDHSYMEMIVSKMMSKKRFLHTLQVAKLSKEIAHWHRLDEDKAYLIALLHDIAKEYPHQQVFMKQYLPQYLEKPAPIYHQYIGAYLVRHQLLIEDPIILNAIKHHTDGLDHSLYSMIVYIADKVEPTRGFDNTIHLNKTKANLYQGYQYVYEDAQAYLKRNKQ